MSQHSTFGEIKRYLDVADDEGKQPVELPLESNGRLLFTSFKSQFPGARGLRFRNQMSLNMRGIKLHKGELYPPEGGWADTVHIAVYRKSNKESAPVSPQIEQPSNLIVKNLPDGTSQADLRDFFSQFGLISGVQIENNHGLIPTIIRVMIDHVTGLTVGFVRFIHIDSQRECTNEMRSREWIFEVFNPSTNINPDQHWFHVHASKISINRDSPNRDLIKRFFLEFGIIEDVFFTNLDGTSFGLLFKSLDFSKLLHNKVFIIGTTSFLCVSHEEN